MLDWVHNKLLVKAGFELDHNADATSLLRNQTGTYTYSKVQNFISDALAFQEFGLADAARSEQSPQLRCNGNLYASKATLGSQPCYSYYSQTIGPTNWHLSTNDWAGYVTAQWQPNKFAVFSVGLRWEREQMPPPIAALANPELPLTGKLAADSGQQLGSARQPCHWRSHKATGRCCASATACTTAARKTPPSRPRSPKPARSTAI